MSTTKKTDIINSLLDLPEFEPETSAVKLPRLGIVLELRELPYDKLVRLSREQDAQIHLILSCVTNHPELKQAEWYKEKMKCCHAGGRAEKAAPEGRGGEDLPDHRPAPRVQCGQCGPPAGGPADGGRPSMPPWRTWKKTDQARRPGRRQRRWWSTAFSRGTSFGVPGGTGRWCARC